MGFRRGLLCLTILIFFSSCYRPACSKAYQEFYAHLPSPVQANGPMQETDYFLVILVDARHLDYTDNHFFLRTVAKHPSDGSKNGDIGHAWIYLKGLVDEKPIVIEGGHSGERGIIQARYFDGIMNYNEWGYANPTSEQMKYPRYEPNPIKYLWTTLYDGFFEKGSGGHYPTFAVKIDLTEEQFKKILNFVQSYPYRQYALTNRQCSSFVAQAAALADFEIDSLISMKIDKDIWFRRCRVRFWEDPQYSRIVFASPDQIEKSLMEAVAEGRADYALDWYLNKKIYSKFPCVLQ